MVEPQIVVLDVAGSSPVGHPSFLTSFPLSLEPDNRGLPASPILSRSDDGFEVEPIDHGTPTMAGEPLAVLSQFSHKTAGAHIPGIRQG